MSARTTAFLAAALIAGATLLDAQAPISKVNQMVINATIEAVDYGAKTITLRDDKGDRDTYSADGVQRLNELKAGQKVKITYYEGIVLQMLKPGETPAGDSVEAALNRAKGALPAGTIAMQEKRSVTVKAVDMNASSVTVTTEDGRQVSRLVQDKKLLSKVKPGDRIDVTYTQAIITSVQAGK